MAMNKPELCGTVEKNMGPAVELLARLIEFPSIRGQERDIGRFLKAGIEPFVEEAALVAIPDSMMTDPDYSFRLENFRYEGTANLRCRLKGTGEGKSLAFNTHLDVVPAGPGQGHLFRPEIKEGKIFGRGACDAKGQIATLWLVLKSLHDLKLKPGGDMIFDFVVEEECGGNGTLKIVRDGLTAEGAVVLEPTDLQVAYLVRGAVWFEVQTRGKAGHSGSPSSTVSALKESVRVMGAIEKVRQELLLVSRRAVAEISSHPDPMPCTFGMLHSGNWPAAVPSEAVLKGVFGFLPPFKRRDIQEKLRQAMDPFRAEIKFNMLNSDPSYIPEQHPLVQTLVEAAHDAGLPSRPEFMNASCDSWRYTEQLGIPAVVFGGGTITSAHGPDEYISLEDVRKAAESLILFIEKWSGLYHA
jgi:acetylornithine deacetylase